MLRVLKRRRKILEIRILVMGANIDYKNMYDKAKGWRKFYLFNIYALVVALIFFIAYRLISWIFTLLDTSLSLGIIYVDIIVALVWGYLMAFIFLGTNFLKRFSKTKRTNKQNKI